MGNQAVHERLSQAVIHLLTEDPLMGEILVNISREIIPTGDVPVDLVWQGNNLILQVATDKINRLTDDELGNELRHQALHLIWRHPLRYADEEDVRLVNLACDVAVNQFLTEPPRGTMTLEQVRQILRRPLPAFQDSSYYLQTLRGLKREERQRLHQQMKKRGLSSPDQLHQGWFNPGNQLIRTAQLTRVIRRSNAQLTAHQRGLLPQPLQQALDIPDGKFQLPLRKALWQLLGQVPNGYQPSRARFNRRQPQRLELPGRVTRLITRLLVFIDQSGSMSNETVSKIITMINELAQQANIELEVADFDAQIETPPQIINRQRTVKYERHGGGGTRYQAVFDYLDSHHINRQTPILIVTDGWGEEKITDYHYRRVLWLLTSANQLSVHNIPTTVIRLEERK